jgi:CHASE2 domain-containing sensor protein
LASKSYKQAAVYVAVLAVCFTVGMTAGWWGPLGGRLDHYAYDEMTKRTPLGNAAPQSVVVAIDERTLEKGGVAKMRPILTKALEQIAVAGPATVAIDVILHDASDDPEVDAKLEAALRTVPKLILPWKIRWHDGKELRRRSDIRKGTWIFSTGSAARSPWSCLQAESAAGRWRWRPTGSRATR